MEPGVRPHLQDRFLFRLLREGTVPNATLTAGSAGGEAAKEEDTARRGRGRRPTGARAGATARPRRPLPRLRPEGLQVALRQIDELPDFVDNDFGDHPLGFLARLRLAFAGDSAQLSPCLP